jgi:hypothetical protein
MVGRADSSPESNSSLNLNGSIHWSKRPPNPIVCSSSAVDLASQGSPSDAGPNAGHPSDRLFVAMGSPARAPPLVTPSAVLLLLLLLLLALLLVELLLTMRSRTSRCGVGSATVASEGWRVGGGRECRVWKEGNATGGRAKLPGRV